MPSDLKRTRVILDDDVFAGMANATRTPGIHLTDVLRDIEEMLRRNKRASANQFDEEDLSQFALQGYLHEDVVERLMTDALREKVRLTDGRCIGVGSYVRVSELAIKLDGSSAFAIDPTLPVEIRTEIARGHLITSPDGRLEDLARLDDRDALVECKWTTKSANMRPESDKRIWFDQVKGYLVVLSVWLRRLVRRVYWHVQFPCATRWGEPPIYEVWEREYEPVECWATFSMVVEQVGYRVIGDVAKGGGTDPHGWGVYL